MMRPYRHAGYSCSSGCRCSWRWRRRHQRRYIMGRLMGAAIGSMPQEPELK